MTMGRNAFDADADAGDTASTDGFARSRGRFPDRYQGAGGHHRIRRRVRRPL